MFQLLTNRPLVPAGADLRARRGDAGLSLATVAEQLGSWPTRISELERRLHDNAELAIGYQLWLDHHHPQPNTIPKPLDSTRSISAIDPRLAKAGI